LSPIKTLTRLLEHRGDDRNFIQEFRRIVTRELERIERLVARLRAVGRPQRTHFGRVDLRKAVIAAVEVLTATAEERKISLTFDITPAPLIVSGDQAEFEEMFLNLVKNAIEAIPDEHLSARNVTIDVSIVDSDAIARVTDTGCGFPETLVDQVFVPFVSTKPHGSGLGLAICASIVQRAGGHIRVANRQGGGGVVTVRLPLA
jgi:signal transduction histidine kinase